MVARPSPAVVGAVTTKLDARIAGKPATTKRTSGANFTAVAMLTKRAPRAAPPALTTAMPPTTTTTTAMRVAPAKDGETLAAVTSPSAEAIPPHASTLLTQSVTPVTKPARGPNAACT